MASTDLAAIDRGPTGRARLGRVDVVTALSAWGGCARRAQLKGAVSRKALETAVRRGRVVKHGRTYALPVPEAALQAARELHGVASHRSAAEQHGFALPPAEDPDAKGGHDVLLPPKARKRSKTPDGVRLHWGSTTEAERKAGVTDPVHTVVLCLRDLSLREALSVGDSALRSGRVRWAELAAAVAALRGPGSRVARERLAMLDARAENAFEPSCRALLIEAGLTGFRPQVTIRHGTRWIGRVDLADRVLKVVVECDGFESHGRRAAFRRDLTRHTRLVAAGWRPLRLLWEQVMYEPDWVLEMVRATVAEAEGARNPVQRPRGPLRRAA